MALQSITKNYSNVIQEIPKCTRNTQMSGCHMFCIILRNVFINYCYNIDIIYNHYSVHFGYFWDILGDIILQNINN